MRYSTGAIALHWLIAALIAANVILAIYMNSLPRPDRQPFIATHAAIGLIVLGLAAVRIGWRLCHVPPSLPWLKPWERRLANSVHAALYGLMVAVPLLGWCVASARGRTVNIFGLIDVPPLPLPAFAATALADVHVTISYLLTGLVALHVGGVIKHCLDDQDYLRTRMWFGSRRSQGRPTDTPVAGQVAAPGVSETEQE